jgi:dTDP-4-amino-4,6-dideoxygalactose transaminase
MAVIVPLKWLQIKPIYADIELETYNISLESIKRRITKKTRAIIVQHTFGIPAEITKIKQYIQEINNEREKNERIYLIEDCAHSLNIKVDDKYLGTFGDVSFFSFGQDKVVSTTQGGSIITNSKDIEENVEKEYKNVPNMPKKIIRYNLRYPLLWSIIKKFYYTPNIFSNNRFLSKFTIGKFLILLFRAFGLIKQQASIDNFGDPERDISKISIKQKHLLKNQIRKIEKLTIHRKKITEMYSKQLGLDLSGPLIRYPILVDYPDIVKNKLQKKQVVIGNWYNYPVIPRGIDLNNINYHLGSCPNTEYAMEHIINLPTDINVKDKDVKIIVDIVKPHLV